MLEEMKLEGVIDIKQAKKKWDNLVKKYRDLKTPKTGTGTENGEDTSASWPYFEAMDDALRHHHNINPPILISSIPFDDGSHVQLNEQRTENVVEEFLIEDDPEFDRIAAEMTRPSDFESLPARKKQKKESLLEVTTQELKRSNDIEQQIADAFISMCDAVRKRYESQQ